MPNVLYHNEGGGRFRDASSESGIAAAVGKGMGVAVNDYDADGFPDIFVSNDLMEQFLFRNRGDGKFEEAALTAGVALPDSGKAFSGMGAAFATAPSVVRSTFTTGRRRGQTELTGKNLHPHRAVAAALAIILVSDSRSEITRVRMTVTEHYQFRKRTAVRRAKT